MSVVEGEPLDEDLSSILVNEIVLSFHSNSCILIPLSNEKNENSLCYNLQVNKNFLNIKRIGLLE